MTNFNDLPGDIKSMIYKVNKEAERDEAYKRNYDQFVSKFKRNPLVEEFEVDNLRCIEVYGVWPRFQEMGLWNYSVKDIARITED